MLEGLCSPEPPLGPDSKSEGLGLILMGLPPIRRKGRRRQGLLRSSDRQSHGFSSAHMDYRACFLVGCDCFPTRFSP